MTDRETIDRLTRELAAIRAAADSATIDDLPSTTSRWQPVLAAIYASAPKRAPIISPLPRLSGQRPVLSTPSAPAESAPVRDSAFGEAFGRATLEETARILGQTAPARGGAEVADPESARGLNMGKYLVRRTDGSSDAGGKHERCSYYVLDPAHDRFAEPALRAYVAACAADYPGLASDICRMLPAPEPVASERAVAAEVVTHEQAMDVLRADGNAFEGGTLYRYIAQQAAYSARVAALCEEVERLDAAITNDGRTAAHRDGMRRFRFLATKLAAALLSVMAEHPATEVEHG